MGSHSKCHSAKNQPSGMLLRSSRNVPLTEEVTLILFPSIKKKIIIKNNNKKITRCWDYGGLLVTGSENTSTLTLKHG